MQAQTVRVYTLTSYDEAWLRQLLGVYAAAFETAATQMPSDYLQRLLQHPQLCFMVALQDVQVVGGLTAHVLPSAQQQGQELYLYDLAVHPAHQRQGIGRQLLTALRARAQDIGALNVFVQADVEDVHALEFYRATGGVGQSVVQFIYPV